MIYAMVKCITFQSTLPARGSDGSGVVHSTTPQFTFQSTLPARGSDLRPPAKTGRDKNFNPRSPQGGATKHLLLGFQAEEISIHAPRKGERQGIHLLNPRCGKFQSTLPARGSDFFAGLFFRFRPNFNPRSPQGGATIRRGTPMRR